MPLQLLGEQKKYLSVLADGNIHLTVTPETPGAIKREYETSDNKVGVKYELIFKDVSGYIRELAIEDGKYGKILSISISDDLIVDEYVLSLGLASNYAEDILKKIKNVDITKPVIFAPWSFEDDKGKTRRGVNMIQNDVKLENFYYDKENKKNLHKFPEAEGDKAKYDSDDWVVYFTKVRKFLVAEITKWAEKAIPADGSHIPARSEDADEPAF